MKTCPNCGCDLNATTKYLVRASAKDLVEGLRVESFIDFHNRNIPPHIDLIAELEAFQDRMRANGYRTNAGPVKDAAAAFRTHLRNAVKFASPRKQQPAAKPPKQAERKEL